MFDFACLLQRRAQKIPGLHIDLLLDRNAEMILFHFFLGLHLSVLPNLFANPMKTWRSWFILEPTHVCIPSCLPARLLTFSFLYSSTFNIPYSNMLGSRWVIFLWMIFRRDSIKESESWAVWQIINILFMTLSPTSSLWRHEGEPSARGKRKISMQIDSLGGNFKSA